MNLLYKLSAVVLFFCISCNNNGTADKQKTPAVVTQGKSEFSKIKLTELDGTPIDLTQYKGKAVFINFWATWCRPCVQELPSIQQAMNKLNNKDIVFLFASNEATAEIEDFKKSNKYSFHYVKVENIEYLNITALPTTYIFNSAGELVFSEMGYKKWDDQTNIDLITNLAK